MGGRAGDVAGRAKVIVARSGCRRSGAAARKAKTSRRMLPGRKDRRSEKLTISKKADDNNKHLKRL